MKRMIGLILAAVMLTGASVVYAGGACCPAGKDAKAVKKDGCGDAFSKLNLTEDQKKKLAALKSECDKAGCSEESRAKFMSGVKGILTEEQLAQCKAECEKSSKGGCPMMKGDSKI